MSDPCHTVAPAIPGARCSVRPAGTQGRTEAELCFPEFCFAEEAWIGSSYIVYQFYLGGAIDRLALAPFATPYSADWVLCVRDGDRRFQFWAVDDVFIPCEPYVGQPLSGDAVFEVWTTPNASTLTVEAFCLPLIYVLDCDGCPCELTSTFDSGAGNRQLWAKFVGFEDSPLVGTITPANDVLIAFPFEKSC